MSDDTLKGGDLLSTSPEPQEAVKELESGRILVKTPDKQFRKNAQGKMVFAKGYKPPGGRPKGSKNKMSVIAAELISENAEKIIKKVIKKALDDNSKDQAMMLKLLIERIAPATRAIDITSINKDEKTITISVEGVTVHENVMGAVEAEVVDFVEEDKDDDA